MIRRILPITLLCTLVAVWPSAWVQAFTLQLGPLPITAETTPGSATSDLPTPQFFRIAFDASGITLGVLPPTLGFQAPVIDISLQDVPVPRPSRPQVARDTRQTGSSPLRGMEVLLLRQAEMMASEAPK